MHLEPIARRLDTHSREARLVCDARGVIQWSDERAQRLLGAEPGMPFAALAAPGSEEALAALFESGSNPRRPRWHLHMRTHNRAVTAWCTAVTVDEWLAILVTVLPDVTDNPPDAQTGIPAGDAAAREHALVQALEERNQGIMALHAELDDKAAAALTSTQIKGRAVASVSHELRTAIHSILGLSKLLLDELDGPLSAEQKTQVEFIRAAADDLSHLAGDLLDLAKLDTGAMGLRVQRRTVADLFAALRGMLAPLLPRASPVALVFDEPATPIELDTDTTKLAQILRYLIANALAFTDSGEVRLTAQEQDGLVQFVVRDTGMGIAPEHHEHIFEEFTRLHPADVCKSGKGSGLGLPLARKLARLLGGDISVASQLHQGATFTLSIPAVHADASAMRALQSCDPCTAPENAPVLLVEDDRCAVSRFEPVLSRAGFPVMTARTIQEGRELLTRGRPAAIVLDIMIEGEASWRFLGQLENTPSTRRTPVLVLTGAHRERKARASHKGELWLNSAAQGHLLRKLRALVAPAELTRVMLVDADERSRYLLRSLLEPVRMDVIEVAADERVLPAVQRARPDVLLMGSSPPGQDLEAMLEELTTTLHTQPIPIVIITPHKPSDEERRRLTGKVDAFLCRDILASELAVRLIEEALCASPAPSTSGRTDHG